MRKRLLLLRSEKKFHFYKSLFNSVVCQFFAENNLFQWKNVFFTSQWNETPSFTSFSWEWKRHFVFDLVANDIGTVWIIYRIINENRKWFARRNVCRMSFEWKSYMLHSQNSQNIRKIAGNRLKAKRYV